jgi:hypothetical protein
MPQVSLGLVDACVRLGAVVTVSGVGGLEQSERFPGLGEHLPGVAPPQVGVAGHAVIPGFAYSPESADLVRACSS